MPHYKPTGYEKEVVQWFKKQMGHYSNKTSVINDLDLGNMDVPALTIGQTVQGVRCNGNQNPNTLIDIYREAKELQLIVNGNLKDIQKYKKILDKVMQTAKKKMAKFYICPVCHGHKHAKGYSSTCNDHNCPNTNYKWMDCDHCKARGLINRKEKL